MGSFWTDSLAGAMSGASGQNVSGTVATANANDPTAPGGKYTGNLPPGGQPERPQNTSANGGGAVNWGPGVGVVFSGNNTDQRHTNNVNTMSTALTNLLGAPVQPAGNDTAGLRGALNQAAQLLPPGGEFVLYVDDHGNTEFDWDEWYQAYTGNHIVLSPTTGWSSTLPSGEVSRLHEGWWTGLNLNAQQGDMPHPGINLLAAISAPYSIDSFFDVFLNGTSIDAYIPDWLFPGQEVFIPLPLDIFRTIAEEDNGEAQLVFLPTGPGGVPLPLLNLELTSGPINDLEFERPWIPGDTNNDGFVNEIDAQTVATFWGQAVTPGDHSHGDFNTDGLVNAADASILAANWGTVAAEATAVPEPGMMVMLITAAIALVGCARRDRRRR
jgi:hypothetical protein